MAAVFIWFRIVSRCKVEELEFRFHGSIDPRIFWDLFRNNTLKGSGEFEITFPFLKKLNLQCIAYFDTNSLTNLLSRCRVLEELFLDTHDIWLTHNLHMVKLSSQSIRRLTIKKIEFHKDDELVIDAPKLEYLHFMSCYFKRYTLVNPESLVEAHISNINWSSDVIQLLRCVSSTKILTLTCESVSWTLGDIRRLNLPMFPYLVKLVISSDSYPLLGLLSIMPNLEYLSFPIGLLLEWNPQNREAAACLRFKLKEIYIVPNSTLQEFSDLSYLLKHAYILEKLRIGEVDPDKREPWLNIHRVSKSCWIEFV